VKTTGSRGFHVTVPLKPRLSFDVTRRLARALAERMIARDPDNLTLMPRKNVRKGRITEGGAGRVIGGSRRAYASPDQAFANFSITSSETSKFE